MNRKLRMGMVGGGTDAFIGAVHRLAALMDNQIELVCGCFSVNPEISKSSGKLYFLPENRVYETYQEMFEKEAKLPEGERMDFVSIVTPNFVHFDPAIMALENGFHVVLDKPMTFTLEEALKLKEKIDETGLTFALTHTYSGYPAVKHAKKMIGDGKFGKIRKISARLAFVETGRYRQSSGFVAHRPKTLGKGRLYGRHWYSCTPPCRIHDRFKSYRIMC